MNFNGERLSELKVAAIHGMKQHAYLGRLEFRGEFGVRSRSLEVAGPFFLGR